jgi:hypothetical protein
MPFKAFKRIHGIFKLRQKPEKDMKIKDAGGNDLGYKGTVLVPMQILGRKIMLHLVILEHVQDYILGIDFIKQHAMSYNSLSKKCFRETPPIDSGKWERTREFLSTHFHPEKLNSNASMMTTSKLEF